MMKRESTLGSTTARGRSSVLAIGVFGKAKRKELDMLKSVFIEYLVKNKERSNGSEFRLAKNAPPEIRKEIRKWRDRRVLSDLPYMVFDFLLEDLKAGKVKKDGDVYR